MSDVHFSVLQDAELEAHRVSMARWFWVGFLLNSIGVLIAYLNSPKPPTRLLAKYDGEDRWLFESYYREVLRSREIKFSWIGFAPSTILLSLWIESLFPSF